MNELAVRLLGGLAIVLGLVGAHLVDKHHAVDVAFHAGQADVNARWTAEKARQLDAAARAMAEHQAEDARRSKAQLEVNDETERFQARAAAAAAASRDAVGRLHERAAAFVAAGAGRGDLPGDPALARERQAAEALRAVLDDSAERHRRMGLEADQAAGADDDCAARYDALSKR